MTGSQGANGSHQGNGTVPSPPVHSLGLLDPKISEARRRQLDVINKLHTLGAHLDIDIPQIVVIGCQSAGKSSLIESISGITLPRASGTCTRCPTECLLIHSPKPWQCVVSIRLETDGAGNPLPNVSSFTFGAPITDPAKVEERIRRAQRAALNPDTDYHTFLDGNPSPQNALDFTKNCISLEISGPDVIDLSFCDLPGLIASVSDGGHDEDIEKVKQMVSSYISKPSCIILLTVACEVDFETQGAYQLTKQHDKQGTRTIGVLTKPDRIPDGETDKWLKLIKNEKSALDHGWYCVKQPGTKELEMNITFQEARRQGEEFFQIYPWNTLAAEHRRRLGTFALTQKLNEHLMDLIAKRFPELLKELQALIRKTRDELDSLPKPASEDPVMELMHLISDFSNDIFGHAEGFLYNTPGLDKSSTAGNQFEPIRSAHVSFRSQMRSTAPDFRPFDTVSADHTHVNEPSFLQNEDDRPSHGLLQPIYLDDVVERVRKATTRELSGYFPFKVIQDLVSCSTMKWETPALDLVDSIYNIVLEHHNSLIENHFGKHTGGGLRRAVLTIVQDYMQQRREEAIKRVKWALELESGAFTLNQHYLDDYRSKFLAFYKQKRQEHLYPYTRETEKWYLTSDPWSPDQYGVEIMATVRAYFQVAYKRVVDNIPLNVDRELVRVSRRNLQEAITLGLKITGSDARARCEALLAEPGDLMKRRQGLKNRLERLIKVEAELASVVS